MMEFLAISLYFLAVLAIGLSSYKRHQNATDFIIGSRSLNYWLTALAAHASDMSSWLFMAYPAMIFSFGLDKIWIALGLILCMFANWHFVAPKIRVATEKSGSLTFFSYLEERFADRTGRLRLASTLICFVFYTIYISAGLVGLGLLIQSLFGISYPLAVFLSISIAVPYILIGGYRTLAWIDLFQGIFLMLIIVCVPLILLPKIGGIEGLKDSYPFPIKEFSLKGVLEIFLVMLGWGLGYFGQPTIITKFMGIKNPAEIAKSKVIGMSWMTISLLAATGVGLVAIPFFQEGLANPEMVFIDLVKGSFSPFFIGLILCAIFAASINVMSSQILVLCSSISEDIYRRFCKREVSSKELLLVSRLSILFVALLAFGIAYYKISTIYALVLYAWSGLGASFGPLIIYSLYTKRPEKMVAWVAIFAGCIGSALWPLINTSIDPIIIGFVLSFLSIGVTGMYCRYRQLIKT